AADGEETSGVVNTSTSLASGTILSNPLLGRYTLILTGSGTETAADTDSDGEVSLGGDSSTLNRSGNSAILRVLSANLLTSSYTLLETGSKQLVLLKNDVLSAEETM